MKSSPLIALFGRNKIDLKSRAQWAWVLRQVHIIGVAYRGAIQATTITYTILVNGKISDLNDVPFDKFRELQERDPRLYGGRICKEEYRRLLWDNAGPPSIAFVSFDSILFSAYLAFIRGINESAYIFANPYTTFKAYGRQQAKLDENVTSVTDEQYSESYFINALGPMHTNVMVSWFEQCRLETGDPLAQYAKPGQWSLKPNEVRDRPSLTAINTWRLQELDPNKPFNAAEFRGIFIHNLCKGNIFEFIVQNKMVNGGDWFARMRYLNTISDRPCPNRKIHAARRIQSVYRAFINEKVTRTTENRLKAVLIIQKHTRKWLLIRLKAKAIIQAVWMMKKWQLNVAADRIHGFLVYWLLRRRGRVEREKTILNITRVQSIWRGVSIRNCNRKQRIMLLKRIDDFVRFVIHRHRGRIERGKMIRRIILIQSVCRGKRGRVVAKQRRQKQQHEYKRDTAAVNIQRVYRQILRPKIHLTRTRISIMSELERIFNWQNVICDQYLLENMDFNGIVSYEAICQYHCIGMFTCTLYSPTATIMDACRGIDYITITPCGIGHKDWRRYMEDMKRGQNFEYQRYMDYCHEWYYYRQRHTQWEQEEQRKQQIQGPIMMNTGHIFERETNYNSN